MKNLVKVESRLKRAAGATVKPLEAEVKGKLIEFLWWMKKQAFAKSTAKGYVAVLKTMVSRGANLWDPELVKDFIARQETWGDGQKAKAVNAYSCFLRMQGLTWEPPRYKIPETLPFIPLESEIDQLIAGCSTKMAAFLQGLKETGADPGELWAIEWADIDKEKRVVRINHPVKRHSPRIVSVSKKWIGMVERLHHNSEKVFGDSLIQGHYQNYSKQRLRVASKIGNPRLLKITFKTLRHFKGTMEYHRTKDILHVKQILGHKNIKNTMIYIHLEAALFQNISDEFHVKVAKTLEEDQALIEVGFEYITERDGIKIYRKRK